MMVYGRLRTTYIIAEQVPLCYEDPVTEILDIRVEKPNSAMPIAERLSL